MLPAACGLLCTAKVLSLVANTLRPCHLACFAPTVRGLQGTGRLRGGTAFSGREALGVGARAGQGLEGSLKMQSKTENNYRACAGAVIFNREGLFLVGERIQGEGQWQFPQGGVDGGESPGDAARREVFEEIGLKVPGVLDDVRTLEESCVYDVPEGTWLSRNGFKGQRMFWTLFFYPGEGLPPVDLSGLGGEKPEFKQVKWMPLPEIVQTVWAMKRKAYVHLETHATPVVQEYLAKL